MKNKILISTLMFVLCLAFLCSYSFATNVLQSAGNTVKNAGTAIGNAATQAGNAIVGEARIMVNGVENMTDYAGTAYGTNTTNYTAQRTATTGTGLFGMSNTMSTWLILGIVGAVIVGLVWYYGAQYEHRNYNND